LGHPGIRIRIRRLIPAHGPHLLAGLHGLIKKFRRRLSGLDKGRWTGAEVVVNTQVCIGIYIPGFPEVSVSRTLYTPLFVNFFNAAIAGEGKRMWVLEVRLPSNRVVITSSLLTHKTKFIYACRAAFHSCFCFASASAFAFAFALMQYRQHTK